MSYTFGTEIARFSLFIYQPGDELSWDDGTSTIVDLDTLKALDDNKGELEPYIEPLSKEQLDNPFQEHQFKVTKTLWLISLEHFSNGGLDYERREGFVHERLGEWAEQAAAIFKERFQPLEVEPAGPLDTISESAKRDPDYAADEFYAVFHSSWHKSGSWEYEEYDMELEFVGVLASTATK